MSVTFHQGEVLPSRIDVDTTLTADKLWIVNDTVRVGEGVTLTIEPGTTVQFYEQNQSKYQYATPKIFLAANAKLICEGTEQKRINFTLAEGYEYFVQIIEKSKQVLNDNFLINFKYAIFANLEILLHYHDEFEISKRNNINIYKSKLMYNHSKSPSFSYLYRIVNGVVEENTTINFYTNTFKNSYLIYGQSIHIYSSFVFCANDISNSLIELDGNSRYVQSFLIESICMNGSLIMLKYPGGYKVESNFGATNLSVLNNCFLNSSSSTTLADFPIINCAKASNNTFYGYPEPFIDRTFGDTKK